MDKTAKSNMSLLTKMTALNIVQYSVLASNFNSALNNQMNEKCDHQRLCMKHFGQNSGSNRINCDENRREFFTKFISHFLTIVVTLLKMIFNNDS